MEKRKYCNPQIEVVKINTETFMTTFSVNESESGISGGVGVKGREDDDNENLFDEVQDKKDMFFYDE
jgi:hypothetical protein